MRKILTILTMAVLALCFSVSAKADTFTTSPISVTLTGTVTAGTAELDITCNDPSCNGWFLGDVTLKGFTSTSFIGTDAGSQPGFTAQNGAQNNSAVGTTDGGGGCNGTQPGMAVCWDVTNSPNLTFQLVQGTTYKFIADITGGAGGGNVSTLHVQATAYSNDLGSQTGGGKVFAISDDLLTTVNVAEPDSLGLLATGLIGLAFVSRRRLLFNS